MLVPNNTARQLRFFLWRLLFSAGIISFIICVFFIAEIWVSRKDYIQELAVPALENAIGQKITGTFSLLPGGNGFSFESVAIGDSGQEFLRAQHLQVVFSLTDILKNILFSKKKDITISEVLLQKAMVSIRQDQDGTYLFFPEKNRKGIKTDARASKESSAWHIKKIVFEDSNIELEVREAKTQVSLGSIFLEAQNMGSSKKALITGTAHIFIRPFGIEKYKEEEGLSQGLYAPIAIDSFRFSLSPQSQCEHIEGDMRLKEYRMYVSKYLIDGESLHSQFRGNCSESFRLVSAVSEDPKKGFVLRMNESDNDKIAYSLRVPRFDIKELSFFFPVLKDERITGEVLQISSDGRIPGSAFSLLANRAEGIVEFDISDIYLPKELSDFFPFNVFFLPAQAVSRTFSVIPKEIVPNPILSLADSISEYFKSAQTFKLHKGNFAITFREGVYRIEEVTMGTDMTSDITIDGTVTSDKNLDITARTSVLGIPYEIMLGGTVEQPIVR